MKSRKFLNGAVSLALSAVLAAELFVILDCAAVFFQLRMVPAVFFCVLGALFVGIHFCKVLTVKRKVRLCLGLLVLVLAICAVSWAVWYPFQKNAAYRDVDEGKSRLYADRSVMVIVPHQDDEANILAGVLEAFADYGSQTRVVYVTNGDCDGIPEIRLQEAIDYCSYAGIPEENVIFLGYGDRWDIDMGFHLYNAPAAMVVPSRYGAVTTYGIQGHPAYRQDNPYTVENYLGDLESVILEYMPEVIFCIDYDDHIEHKAVSLAFEKGMGNILKNHPDYRPLVLKGYAYGTAWYAEADYYSRNVSATKDLFEAPYLQKPVLYRWEDAIRFPVDAAILSRSLVNSDGFRSLQLYSSQNAQYRAESILNGDKVFWQRRTDSLCIPAGIRVSSGEGQRLNDFMLVDNLDLREQADPIDGAWVPDEGDSEKTAEVTFPEKRDISTIVLYDHPGEKDNVRNAIIAFEDGTSFETGPLHPTGAATEIPVNKTGVKSFHVILTETEGSRAGLGEIEAYEAASQGDIGFVKFMDPDGNFAYDYCVSGEEAAHFQVYTYGDVPAVNGENYAVSCDNHRITVTLTEGGILVQCPEGEQGTIRLICEEADVSDSIFLRNPGKLWEIHTKLGQTIERFAVFQFRETILSRVGRRVLGLLN